MPHFFSNPFAASVEHSQRLTQYDTSSILFNAVDSAHTQLLADCTLAVKQKLSALQAVDKKVLIGFSVGTAAFALSYLLPFGTIALGAFAYGAYQLGQRERAYIEYKNALENLIGCCKWSLGTVADKTIINNGCIRDMIITLAPLTNELQLRDYIDDKYEDVFMKQADTTKAHTSVMNYPLNQEEATLYYKIYGYEQGGAMAMLEGLKYAIVNGFNALKRKVTSPSTEADSTVGTTARLE